LNGKGEIAKGRMLGGKKKKAHGNVLVVEEKKKLGRTSVSVSVKKHRTGVGQSWKF